MKELRVNLTFTTPLIGHEGQSTSLKDVRYGFSRRNDGTPIIHAYEIRKFFEEANKRIRQEGLSKGAGAYFCVGFEPGEIPIAVAKPVYTEVRSMRHMTPLFKHEFPATVEVIPTWSTCDFSILCFRDADVFTARRCLDRGADTGLFHQWGSNGQFVWEEIY